MVSDNNVTLYDIKYNNDIYDIIISDIGLLDKNKQYNIKPTKNSNGTLSHFNPSGSLTGYDLKWDISNHNQFNDYPEQETIDWSNFLKKYITDITFFHLKERNIVYDKNQHLIEFSLMKYSDNLFIDYNKKSDKSPLFSTISFLSENNLPMIFSNIDIDSYKYKDIPDENSYKIIIPKKYTHVIFDSSKYYGFLNINTLSEEAVVSTPKDLQGSSLNTVLPHEIVNFVYLKINFWNLELPSSYPKDLHGDIGPISDLIEHLERVTSEGVGEKDLTPFGAVVSTPTPTIYYNNSLTLNKNIINNNINDEILYNTNENDTINKIYNILYGHATNLKQYTMFNLNFKINNNLDYSTLFNKYGIIIDDILQPSNTNTIDEKNRFNRNKIFKNVFSIDVCYWIINESEIYNKWIISNYYNYELSIKVECLPHVLNYVLFSSYFWILHFKEVYNIPDNIKIAIRDVFVSKNKEKFIYKDNTIEKNLLVCNVQLNDKIDYIGGEIIIENTKNSESNYLNQGDMIIYHSIKERKDEIILKGEIYSLVFIIEFDL